MDELKDKFKSLMKKAKPGSSGFSGQGHRLGTAADAGGGGAQPPRNHAQARGAGPGVPAAAAGSSRGASSGAGGSAAAAAPRAPPRSQVDPSQQLQPATEFSPFTAVIGGGAARTTNSMAPSSSGGDAHYGTSQPPQASGGGGAAAASSSSGGGASSSRAAAAARQQPAAAVVSADALEEMQHCVALIASQQEVAGGSMQVLSKLLSNLLAAPQEAKFRQLRLGPDPNPKIKAAVLDVAGATELLQACGFELHDDASEGPGARFAVFLDDAKLPLAEAGLDQLALALSQQQQQQQPSQQPQQPQRQPQQPNSSSGGGGGAAARQPPAAAAASPAAVPRATQVVLPAAPDTTVEDWFFERTPAEVKAEYVSLMKQRAAGQVFASKAWRTSQQGGRGGGKAGPAAITLRVRFPEGVCLQGCFGTREPLTAVFDWVTCSLRDPGLTYTLVAPDRHPLPTTGTVGSADLAGAVLFFRALAQHDRGYLVDSAGRQQPFLADALLLQARVD